MIFLTMTWPDGHEEDVSVGVDSDEAKVTLARAVEHIGHLRTSEHGPECQCDWKIID